jgi:hypothetical protein
VFAPADLRAGDVALLLDLDWCGRVFRAGEREATITALDGSALVYSAALDTGGAVRDLALFQDASSPMSLDCTLYLADLTEGRAVASLVDEGHDLQTAQASVYAALPDSDERVLLFRGLLDDVDYGGPDEPVTFSVAADTTDSAGRTHEEAAKVSTDSLGDAAAGGAGNWRWDTDAEFEWYPTVIGKPGPGDGSAFGSPATGLNITGTLNGVLVAGHPVKATSVYVESFDGNAQSGTQSTTEQADLLGRRITLADVGTWTSPRWDDGSELWVDWGASSGGLVKPGGDLLRGAGDVLVWLARRTSMPWDFPALEAIAPALNPYLIDAAIIPSPGERLSPWTWATDHVLPLLPVSVVSGPGGLRLALWRPDATAAEAVAVLDTSRNCERSSSVAYSARGDVRNELRIDYGVDARRNRPTRSAIATGHQATLDSTAGAHRLPALVESEQRYGYRPADALRAAAVWDDATAARYLAWKARMVGRTTRAVEYDVEPGLGHLGPADVVTVTDPDVALAGRVALVEQVRLLPRGARVTVRLY